MPRPGSAPPVLTDGAEWHLHRLVDGALQLVSSLTVDPNTPDVDMLCVWLEGVLATAEQILPTAREFELRLGVAGPAHALNFAEPAALYAQHRKRPRRGPQA